MKGLYWMLLCIALLACSIKIYSNFIHNENGERAYVPDAETAIKVAEAIWLPIYGERIYQKKPFKARLKSSNVWIVEGTLQMDSAVGARSISITVGGVPYIEIQKSDCKILKVTHGK